MTEFLEFSFELAKIEQADTIFELESESYPEDEAATLDKIKFRLTYAPEYFYVLKKDDIIVGFVNGTCIEELTIHHESMSDHVPNGKSLVIHSVTIKKEFRRKGLALHMLKLYLGIMKESLLQLIKIFLLCKANLLSLYMQAGFSFVKISPVVHGKEKWIEMEFDLVEVRGIDQYQVDAFTSKAFGGNPAAVVLVQKDPLLMQNIAMENNLAETSFLEKIDYGRYKLRWFTPANEVELCGHATLAAAHILYECSLVDYSTPITFETLFSGNLLAQGNPDGSISLTFPSTPAIQVSLSKEELEIINNSFGITINEILFVGRSLYDLLIEITPEAFNKLSTLNYSAMELLGGRGVILTCGGDKIHDNYDFKSRCFFPRYGINEDPVTGSAHCALAPYWFEKLQKYGQELIALQASKRRGELFLKLAGDNNDKVILRGFSMTTIKSKILL